MVKTQNGNNLNKINLIRKREKNKIKIKTTQFPCAKTRSEPLCFCSGRVGVKLGTRQMGTLKSQSQE